MKILIVDDQRTVRAVIGRLLSRRGCEVVEAASASRTLAVFEAELPDGVLLDLNVPGADGLSLARELIALRAQLNSSAKVVLCSGCSHAQLIVSTEQCGADGFGAKSEGPTATIDKLISLIATRSR